MRRFFLCGIEFKYPKTVLCVEMVSFSIRRFNPARSIPYAELFAPGVSLVETQGFEFETRPPRLSLRTVLRGEVTYEANGVRRTIRPGEIAVVGTGLRLLGGTARKLETVCFTCYPKDGWRWFEDSTHELFVRIPVLPDGFQNELDGLARAAAGRHGTEIENRFDRFMVSAGITLLGLRDLADRVPAKRARTRNDVATKVMVAEKTLHEMSKSALDLELVARRCGIARHHLTRVFKETHGRTPRQFHEKIRIESAARELREGGEPVGSIARAHGYSAMPVFTRAFSRVMGLSPAGYRTARSSR